MVKMCPGSTNEDQDKLVEYIEMMAANRDDDTWQGVVKFEIRLPAADFFMVTIEDVTKDAVKDLVTLSSVCSITGAR